MKILHVVNVSFVLPYYLGDQILYFNKKKISISIACTESIDLYEFSKKYNITAFPIKISRQFDFFNDIFSIYTLYKIIKNEKFDAVIGHTPKGGLISMISSFLLGTRKRVYFRHGLMYETSKGLKRKVLIFIEKVTSLLATDVVCVSNSVLQKSIKNNLSSKKKCKILHNGTCNGIDSIVQFNPIYTDKFKQELCRKELNIGQNDIVVGFVGRLVKDKGVNELIEAWKLLLLKHNNIKLVILGPVEKRDPIYPKTLEYIKTEKSINYLGEITNPAIYYSIFNILILPSYREGFPTVVLEASSMMIPVITTKNTGCIDSILENKTGVFCEINSQSIAKSIDYYLSNKSIRIQHGINGRSFVVNNFSQTKIWDEIISIIKN